MNLDNLNLVELNAQEVQEVDGGVVGVDDVLLAVGIASAVLIIENWSDIKKGALDAWYGR
ncbi:hypothetical protein [Flavobacterium xanthum]|uniref:Class IIb bacteriocin, lactobin A/cerein 7B family n=1 Tax=Flavobacterium xanthum TaxID=69322 RepID=A0A1M7LHC6_9FLAO|nr:hypothetical protein [Flavobacterium xanthum]SHM77545.1 hypothetical protein SAMN05443669_10724 [Flavobacterium xanthum]